MPRALVTCALLLVAAVAYARRERTSASVTRDTIEAADPPAAAPERPANAPDAALYPPAPAPAATPSWVPPDAPLTIVSAPDLYRNLGLTWPWTDAGGP